MAASAAETTGARIMFACDEHLSEKTPTHNPDDHGAHLQSPKKVGRLFSTTISKEHFLRLFQQKCELFLELLRRLTYQE